MSPRRDESLDESIEEAIAALVAVGEPVPPDIVWEMVEPPVRRGEFLAALRSDRRVRIDDEGWVSFRADARIPARPGDRSATAIDLVIDALTAAGEPMTFESIQTATGDQYSARSLKSRIAEDARIMRTDRDSFGLTEWGFEPYDGLVNMMKRSIERQGGEAAIDDIISDLARRFTFKERSVRTFARSEEFISAGRGRIRIREDHERTEEQPAPTSSSPNCVVMDRRWALRVTIDDRLLAGYSVDLPPGFGMVLGVPRGDYAQLEAEDGWVLGVSRKVLNDSLGRLRPVAESIGLEPGDVLFVIAPRRKTERIAFRYLRFEELAEMDEHERVAALLGIDAALDTTTVARALDMPTRSTAAALVATLRRRGEEALADELESVLDESGTHGAVDAADIADALGF